MTRSCPRQGKVAPLGDERGSLPRSRAAVVWFSSAEGWLYSFILALHGNLVDE